jgi:hypothetical protein|tara:strand:- start:2894 stop:3175 length:282 start_codon:yes stop_codon:yes gene_type:complete
VYLLAVKGRENEAAYAVPNSFGEKVLYLFEEEDDAERYVMMLEENSGYPEMNIIEVDDDAAVHVCESQGYQYAVITADDIVIPPEGDDFISED